MRKERKKTKRKTTTIITPTKRISRTVFDRFRVFFVAFVRRCRRWLSRVSSRCGRIVERWWHGYTRHLSLIVLLSSCRSLKILRFFLFARSLIFRDRPRANTLHTRQMCARARTRTSSSAHSHTETDRSEWVLKVSFIFRSFLSKSSALWLHTLLSSLPSSSSSRRWRQPSAFTYNINCIASKFKIHNIFFFFLKRTLLIKCDAYNGMKAVEDTTFVVSFITKTLQTSFYVLNYWPVFSVCVLCTEQFNNYHHQCADFLKID